MARHRRPDLAELWGLLRGPGVCRRVPSGETLAIRGRSGMSAVCHIPVTCGHRGPVVVGFTAAG